MTHDELNQAATASLEDRVRDAIKGVLEQVMEEEMDAQLQAKHRERTERRLGERNGHYGRGLTTTAGHIEQIRVPRAREMPFLTEVFERYRRMTGSLEEAVLEMYLQGVSTRKVEEITGKLSGTRISKDAVSRIVGRFDDVFSVPSTDGTSGAVANSTGSGRTRTSTSTRRTPPRRGGRESPLGRRRARRGAARPPRRGGVAVGVNDQGFREVLAALGPPPASARRRTAGCFADGTSAQGLVERGLRGVKLVISDDHEAIKSAVKVELPGAAWQRCVVHFERNILAHVPQTEVKAVAADLKVVFKAARRETAEGLAASFAERYEKLYPKAVASLTRGLDEALTPPAAAGGTRASRRHTTGSSARRTGWSVSSGRSSGARASWESFQTSRALRRWRQRCCYASPRTGPSGSTWTWTHCTPFFTNPQDSLLDRRPRSSRAARRGAASGRPVGTGGQ